MDKYFYNPWPELPYDAFKATLPLLHMATQAVGKLKLSEPFEPHWANVALWLTSRGLTTGPINYKSATYSIDFDFIDHQIICTSSWGKTGSIKLKSMSVAELTEKFFKMLHKLDIEFTMNLMPMEIPAPIPFNFDTEKRPYDAKLVNAWWHILLSTNRIMQQYHARFTGISPPIGLMWGTLDLRDARYKGISVSTDGPNSDFIRRNAMDDAQVEIGFWSGNPAYPRPAFFSFTYPQPAGIEQVKLDLNTAKWEPNLGEFILDYDDLRQSKNPDKDLFTFFESTYSAGSKLAGWNAELIGTGKPI